MLETIDDQNIGPLLANEGLTVLLMSSPWDGNGIILRSIIMGMTERFPSVQFREAAYETSPRLARLFNLTSPPGLLLIVDGELVERITKPVSAGKIVELIQHLI